MSDPTEPTESVANGFALAVMEMRATLQPIIEATQGYRDELTRNGWSETAAEAMAMEFHRLLIAQVMRGTRS